MTNVAVYETNQLHSGSREDAAPVYRSPICAETIVFDILARAAELDAPKEGVLHAAAKRLVGVQPGTLYYSGSYRPRGRHERTFLGKHALERSVAGDETNVRPLVPQEKEKYTPRHVYRAIQQDTVQLPITAKHRATPQAEAGRGGGRWKVVVAGLGATAVTCAGMNVVLDKDMKDKSDGAVVYSLPPEGLDTQQRLLMPSRRDRTPAEKQHPIIPLSSGLTAAQKAKTEKLITSFQAVPAAELKGVCPSALLAKAVVVSKWGESDAARLYNNPFGLQNKQGKLVRYSSLTEGVRAQVRRIITSPYYKENALFSGQAVDSCAPNGRTFLLATKTNKEARVNLVFNFFDDTLADAETAGLVGNSEEESGVNPATVQTVGGSAKGMMQWEKDRFAPKPGKKSKTLGLKAFAAQRGKHWSNFWVQLAYIKYEFSHHEKRAYRAIKAADTVTEASVAVTKKYERPDPNPKTLRMKERIESSKRAYKEHIARKQQVGSVTNLMKKPWFASIFSKRTATAQG